MKLPDVDIFRPDKHRLDEELQEQPKLCRIYSDHYADAVKELDESKSRLELVEADLDRMVRRRPEDFGVDKITEVVVRREIVLHKQYQAANTKLIEAQYVVNQLKGICNAIEHRKKSIEGLIYLHGQGYWAEPRISGERRKPLEDQIAAKAFTKRRTSN